MSSVKPTPVMTNHTSGVCFVSTIVVSLSVMVP